MSSIKNPILKSLSFASLLLITICQAIFLRHELVDCYPYKVMDLADQANLAARFAVFIGPVAAILISIRLFWVRSTWLIGSLISLVSAVVVPIVFLATYSVFTFPSSNLPSATEFTPEAAMQALYASAFHSAVFGLLVAVVLNGFICASHSRSALQRA